jgi:hypothetical protein
VGEGHLNIALRAFNTVVHFLPPTVELPTWQLAVEQITGGEDGDELEVLGGVSVAQVIDTVPGVIEEWVLAITHEAADYLSEFEDDQVRQAGMRLRSEHEQGEAHSARWKTRADALYGDMAMYDFPDDAELSYERIEVGTHAALLVTDADDRIGHVLVAPSTRHPWRWSTPDHVDDYGERLSVREAMQRATAAHEGWVRQQTALALGEALAALRGLHEQALSGTDPESLRELGRLAGHAQTLAEGLQAPLV